MAGDSGRDRGRRDPTRATGARVVLRVRAHPLMDERAWSGNTSQHLLDPTAHAHAARLRLLRVAGGVAPRVSGRGGCAWRSCWKRGGALSRKRIRRRALRENTMALGYEGDTVFQLLGDILACASASCWRRQLGGDAPSPSCPDRSRAAHPDPRQLLG